MKSPTPMQPRARQACAVVCSLGAMLAVSHSEARAQRIEGRVVDATSGAPIPNALLQLQALTGDTIWAAVADDSGRFVLRSAQAGSFMVHAQSLGYLSSQVGPIRVEDDRATTVELRLSSSALQLESIQVLAQPRNPMLERNGFYSRRRFGFGVFMDRAEIERKGDVGMTGLFRGRAGIRIMRTSMGRPVIVLRGATRVGSNCPARVLINGLDAYEFDLELDLNVDAIEGVEIFPGATVPAEFGGPRSGCGVVLFWLRH